VPPTLKEQFINWLGPKIVRELYAGTEAQAATIIEGHEWARSPRARSVVSSRRDADS